MMDVLDKFKHLRQQKDPFDDLFSIDLLSLHICCLFELADQLGLAFNLNNLNRRLFVWLLCVQLFLDFFVLELDDLFFEVVVLGLSRVDGYNTLRTLHLYLLELADKGAHF